MRASGSRRRISVAARVPPPPRHVEVEHDDLRAAQARELDRLVGVGRRADELDAGLVLGDEADEAGHQRVVVGHQDADRRRLGGASVADRSTRLRPPSLARYSARSARSMSASAVSPGTAGPATPTLTVTCAAGRMRASRAPRPLARSRSPALGRGVERLLGQQHEELLAAEAVQRVAAAHRLAERVREAAQDLVALEVAGVVVERLEVVDVDQRDAPGVAVALRARLHGHEVLVEAVAVADPGQRVLARVGVQAAVQRR